MVVSKSAVREYLAKPLRDSSKAKALSEEEIDERIALLDPQPDFHTKPHHHQKVCFLLGAKYDRYFFSIDMGTGKTKLSLDLIAYKKKQEKVKRALVLVPYASNTHGWVDECEIHTPELSIKALHGLLDVQTKIAAIEDKSLGVCVITYNGWLSLVCDRQEEKKGFVINEERLKRYLKLFQVTVCDESSLIGGTKSLYFRVLRRATHHHKVRYVLTGTPVGGNIERMWHQAFVVDRGETFGTLGMFRAAYFKVERNWYTGWDEFKFDKKKADDVHRRFRNISIRYAEEECQDLPEKVYSTRRVLFADEDWENYEALIEDMKAAHGNHALIENAFWRMVQMTSGYLVMKDALGDKVLMPFSKQPKMDALVDLIKEIPEDRKFIIFHILNFTGELITAKLDELKIKHSWLYGKTKDKKKALDAFLKDDSCRCMACSTAGAFGLNLQVANYGIFYESPTPPDIRKQMEKRIHREGQERRVYYYDLTVKNSIDEKIIASLESGGDLMRAITDGKVRW